MEINYKRIKKKEVMNRYKQKKEKAEEPQGGSLRDDELMEDEGQQRQQGPGRVQEQEKT